MNVHKRLEHLPIVIIILVNLVVGLFTISHYGESWDDQPRIRRGTVSIQSYTGERSNPTGVLYYALGVIGSEELGKIWNTDNPRTTWHFFHFMTFQVGLISFYLICLRLMNKWIALGSTILFMTQPLIWGHASMNPKDTPFMALFLVCVAAGMHLADSYPKPVSDSSLKFEWSREKDWLRNAAKNLLVDWQRVRRKCKIILSLLLGSLIGIWFVIYLTKPWILFWLTDLVRRAYAGEAGNIINPIFQLLAEKQSSLPVETYIAKAARLIDLALTAYPYYLVIFVLFIAPFILRKTLRYIWRSRGKPFYKSSIYTLRDWRVWMTGITWGFSTSIRIVAPAAAGIACLYFIKKQGRRAFPALAACFVIMLLAGYASWPSLWGNPLNAFQNSVSNSIDFPFEGKVLFQGVEYNRDQLPVSYLPVLLALQFTEPALLLSLVGLVAAIIKIAKRSNEAALLLLISLWFFIPLLAVMIAQPPLYDNFRHFLFITPPIFILAGFGMAYIIKSIKYRWIGLLLAVILISPNIYWNVQLFPYQYIYFNSLTGGIRGAFRNYELDYWVTSYKEAIDYINIIAPDNARIYVWGAKHIARVYTRPDLDVVDIKKSKTGLTDETSYALISSKRNLDLTLFPDAPEVYRVERQGVLLSVVRQIKTP